MTVHARTTPFAASLAAPLAMAALALGLGACSRSPAPSADASSQGAVDAGEGVAAEPEASETTAVPTSVAETAPVPTTIPQSLRGRWGLLNADCTSTAGDAKGLLTISAKQLRFYESVADLKSVKSGAADALTGRFDFTGEGQSWSLQVALASPDGGRTLVRKDTGPDALPQALTYTKCA